MGGLCNSSMIIINSELNLQRVIPDKDFQFKSYKSNYDNVYERFDKDFNYLKYLQFSEFASFVTDYKFDNEKRGKEGLERKMGIFIEEIEKKEFIIFIESRIIKNQLLYSYRDDTKQQIFNEFMTKIYEVLTKGLVSYYKKVPTTQNTSVNSKKFRKFFFFAIGLLFCSGYNTSKVDVIFQAFSNENGKLQVTDNFRLFLYILFLLASYCSMKAIIDLSKTFTEEITQIKQEDQIKMLNIYDVNDIVRLVDSFVTNFYGRSQSFSYLEYRDKIISDGFDWWLNGKGIRYQLEHKNEEK